jgi:hypothetical protein
MTSKFTMRSNAYRALAAKQQRQAQLVESLLVLHGGDFEKMQACMEGVVDILGSIVARLNAGKNPLNDLGASQEQRAVLGIIAGAKVLMDHPDAVAGHNLTPNKLRAVITQAGANVDATKMLHQVAKSAPDVTSGVVQMFQRYTKATETNDQQTADAIKRELQRLWLYWQKNMPMVAKPQEPAPRQRTPTFTTASMGR